MHATTTATIRELPRPARAASGEAFAPTIRTEVDLPRIEAAVREILAGLGENPDRDGLIDTPRRVAKAFAEMLSGLREDASDHLGRVFEHQTKGDDLVVVRDIEFSSMCEHHLLPFLGKAQVAYLPDHGKVVGLSKIARTVDVFARRPQLQERLTAQIADAIEEHLGARGVAVIIEGRHMCMTVRGVRKPGADMVTTAFRGLLERNHALRDQALGLLRQRSASW
jgi:GTP cyclohydrolase I